MVIPVVMQVEHPVQLRVAGDVQVLGRLQTLADGLPRVFLHLDVVELSAKKQGEVSFVITPTKARFKYV